MSLGLLRTQRSLSPDEPERGTDHGPADFSRTGRRSRIRTPWLTLLATGLRFEPSVPGRRRLRQFPFPWVGEASADREIPHRMSARCCEGDG